MEINCPNGYVWNMGKYTIPRTVRILMGVCDHDDLCGVKDCKYHNESPEATERYVRALLDCSDLSNGMQSEENRKTALYKKLYNKGLRVVK